MNIPDKLIAMLRQGSSFVIASHIDPDGDTLGSALAISSGLEKMGKSCVLYGRDPVPEAYRFLPGSNKFTPTLPHLSSETPVILIDCNSPDRAGLDKADIPCSAVIDHHETASGFGEIIWIAPEAAATGLMIYHLLKKLDVEITKDMAVNLYTGIAIDTGTFRFSNTTSEVLKVSADLVDSGADPCLIAEAMYNSWTDNRFMLLIKILDTLEVVDDIAITYVSKKIFADTGTAPEHTENFSNFPRMMKSVSLSAFFTEMENGQWKASLRSKGRINVAAIARTFGGGGHKNAAGFTMKADLETVKQAFLSAVLRCGS